MDHTLDIQIIYKATKENLTNFSEFTLIVNNSSKIIHFATCMDD